PQGHGAAPGQRAGRRQHGRGAVQPEGHRSVSGRAMIQIQGLNQFYGGSHILWDVDMSIPQGSCTVLMGRNGMGKTTLLRCLMGLTPTASGSIRYGEEELSKAPATRR